jgi:hypothetical protein
MEGLAKQYMKMEICARGVEEECLPYSLLNIEI